MNLERSELFKQIHTIFVKVLDDEAIDINENTQASDVEGWDSLTHIQLVVAIEKHFNIRFTSREIQTWQNVGQMVDCIQSK